MYNRVYKFLTDTGQIYECQYRFRSEHSCKHAIGQLVGHVIKNLELKKDTISVFLDLSKAFDSLQHDIILQKMERYGLHGVTLSWFRSYLENRKLRIKCRTSQSGQVVKSDTFPIEYGTPQGSCLGPLIFLIFCNDLRLHLQFLKCIQFADNTTLLFSHANKHYLRFCVMEDLLSIQDWFNANKLTLNLSKTVYLFFEHKARTNIDLDLTLNGVTIPRMKHTKFLGVCLDDQLNWKHHMHILITRLNSQMGLLKREKNLLSSHAKKVFYFGQIHSLIMYGMSIWGTLASKSILKHIQIVQNTCLKCIEPRFSLSESHKKHKILKIKDQIKLEQYKLGYKACNNMLPVRLVNCLFMDSRDRSLKKSHRYNTRHKEIPNVPVMSSTKYRNSFMYRCIKEYTLFTLSNNQKYGMKSLVKHCKELLIHKY